MQDNSYFLLLLHHPRIGDVCTIPFHLRLRLEVIAGRYGADLGAHRRHVSRHVEIVRDGFAEVAEELLQVQGDICAGWCVLEHIWSNFEGTDPSEYDYLFFSVEDRIIESMDSGAALL